MAWAVGIEWTRMRAVKDELECVIQTIARFEPIRLLVPPELVLDQ
jgi:hypothetical protein